MLVEYYYGSREHEEMLEALDASVEFAETSDDFDRFGLALTKFTDP